MSSQPAGRRRRARGATALLVVLVAVLTGCSAQPDRPVTTPVNTAVGADASRSRAAELQAGLTHLLVERVQVTATARAAVAEADRVEAAAALDDSSAALADLLGATFTGARGQLLAVLRSCDRRGLRQADAVRTGSPDDVATALADLQTGQADLAATVRRVVPRMPAEQIRARLDGDLAAQLAVQGDAAFAQLRAASGRAPATAALLTAGIAADRGLGPVGTRAATLRAALTGLLTEHVQLAGAMARLPGDARTTGAAVAALQANGADLTALLGQAYPDLPSGFGPMWAGHVERLVGLAADPSAEQRRRVLAFPNELGNELARHVVGLSARTTGSEFTPLLSALAAAVEGGDSPGAHAALRRASAAVPAPSALVAAAIAQDRRYT